MPNYSLTTVKRDFGGCIAHEYEVNGETFLVRDSALNLILVSELLCDELFSWREVMREAKNILFGEFVDDDVLAAVLWEASGIDIKGEHEGEPSVWDWETDAARIRSSLMMAYGIDWDECCRSMSYREVCDLLGMLLETESRTPFAEAIYYRTAKPPRDSEVGRDYARAWRERARYYSLNRPTTEQEAIEADKEASKVFDSLWKAANG